MNPLPSLALQVKHYLDRQQLPVAGVVAVSGGPDSVALLRALVALRRPESVGPLVVAHLNHRLRGADSDADEEFVHTLHSTLSQQTPGLELRCEGLDVAAVAQSEGDNIEAVGRRLRYDWLGRVAEQTGCTWIATGHTANDQAETVLHRLVRGSGLRGLRGIAARRALRPGVELIRPLLNVTRADVLAYLAAECQVYREDRSNLDLEYTRNRIRHELLPHLAERYNPAVVQVLGRLAEQADEAYCEVEKRARALLIEAELPRAGATLVFNRQRLAAAERHLVREALRLVWDREGWPTAAMSFTHWDRVAAVVFGELSVIELPGGVHARGRERVVQIEAGS